MELKKIVSALAAMAAVSVTAGEYAMKDMKMNHADGIYKCGETVEVQGLLLKNKQPVADDTVLRCRVKWEGTIVKSEDVKCKGTPFKVSYTSQKPGWVYFDFQVLGADGKPLINAGTQVRQRIKKTIVYELGAMFSPEQIKTAITVPAGFDAYWAKKKAELAKLPWEVKAELLQQPDATIELYALTVNCLGGRPATGYLARPVNARNKSLPLFVDFLSWSNCDASRKIAINFAKKGALGISATWHGLPVGQSPAYYQTNCRIAGATGRSNPDTWTFQPMFLRVLRMIAYAKSRPEWNGKDLILQGGSLAGAQVAAGAALDKDVTMAIISVPCFCEFAAYKSGRKMSIPTAGFKLTAKDEDSLGHFDVVNFATRIKCEVYFCTGFADELCPPSNVIAAYNNVPAGVKKSLSTNPMTGHYGTTANVKGNKKIADFFKNITVQQYTEKYR